MQSGGAERVAALLCNRWAEQGHKVTLIVTFSMRGECFYPLHQAVKLEYLTDRSGGTGKNAIKAIRRFLSLRRIIITTCPDVVISFLSQVNVATLLAVLGLRIPVVVSERIYPPAMPLAWHWDWLRKITYPSARKVVMQTEQGLEWLYQTCPKANGKIIANPVFYPLPANGQQIESETLPDPIRYRLLAVGRLEPQKQFADLILAFSQLELIFPHWDLTILGEGSERTHLEFLIAETGLMDRVLLPGCVGNIADWYNRSDLYVMSSNFEGFPNVILEAMSYGLPVVSFDCKTGPRDIIRHNIDGLLVPPETGVEGLAKSLKKLMADDILRAQMGRHATSVKERFAITRIGALWDEILGI
ncbi:glycosyltransferase involved in cell wall biosynthesis [Thiobaca trueperi]|uniref:Glycosyltransferase involved in cell wall biosynthesis n=2 Tax=Thiobaca trueperi TaxID=127458 RepID=A0A4R3N303_9GAMM|nr:glycosyltransferase involved in cell wall biosynthesis [Thiobaca trueperi]